MSLAKNDDFCNVDIIEGTGEILRDKTDSGKIRPWSKKKMSSLELAKLFHLALEKDETIITPARLFDLENCGSFLKFAETPDGKRKLVDANFCRLRLCPMCNWRRSLKMFCQVSEVTNLILSEKPTVRFLFVTLTIKNVDGENLQKTMDAMNDAFKKFVNKNHKISYSETLKNSLLGYMKAFEVTYNSRENNFHPHIHCLFEVKAEYFSGRNYIKQSEWREMWKKAMKLEYLPLVNVKVIKKSTSKAVAELAKYPTKIENLTKLKNESQAVDALITLKNSLHGRRLLTFGGDFKEYRRRLKLDDVENGDLIHTSEENEGVNIIAYTLFKFDVGFGVYVC